MLAGGVRATIRRHGLLSAGDRVLVAVSGGPDSVALLHVLVDLRRELGIDLVVAHLDHALRPGSADDARFVARLADRLGLRCVADRLDVGGPRGEDAARRARYAFLERAAREVGAGVVAVGHQADDQVETILLRLLRGTGPGGLAGMPISRPLGTVRLVRPLLETPRSDILAYLADRKIAYRDDPTNLSEDFERNRIRLKVLPFLQSHDSRIGANLLRLAALARDEDSFVEAAARAAYPRAVRPVRGGGLRIDAAALERLPPALRRRVVRAALEAAGAAAVEFDHVAAVLDLVHKPGGRLDLRGLEIERTGGAAGGLTLRRPGAAAAPGPVRFEIAIPGETAVAPLGLVVEASIFPRGRGVVPLRRRRGAGRAWTAVMDADAVRPPVVIRTRLAGDRIAPLGMRGTRKLQDLLVDEKVPRSERDRLPVVADAEGVIWVVGIREAERTKVRRSTRRCLRLEVRDVAPAGPPGEGVA